MRCPDCGADSPADKKFCADCGAPLTLACLSCGSINSRGEQFCASCGTPLAAPGLREAAAAPWIPAPAGRVPGEIKQLTVLFCDIVNSTALAERLGAEAMSELVVRFVDTSLAEVHRYGGTAPQFRGDGFMALFGAPHTQEDHVRRALLAALAILRVVAEEKPSDNRPRLDLEIRIGIHTGPAVFGRIGGGFPTETAIGDTANVAARLEQAASPGTILVSGAVHALARSYASFEPVGAMDLKGKSAPVAGYRLLGVSRWRAGRDGVSPARLTRFVGRDAELARLGNLLRKAEAGHGQVVGIVGDPGIGKSRLLAEFRRRLGEDQVVWVEGGCLSYGAGIPYLLALDVLRGHCGIGETDSAEAIAQKVRTGLRAAGIDADQDSAVLLHLLGLRDEAGAPALANPEAVKAKSFEVLQRLCLDGSRQRTLVLALEDLHWIDTISQELLAALVQKIGTARILLLACYRPEYCPPWAGNPEIAEISLQPLSPGDSLHVVHSVLQGDDIASPLAEAIVARADGNPLFLEQLALHTGEAKDGRGELTVPQTIHGVVMARIDGLPSAEKQLLQTAAVIGREFSLRLLRAVWSGREPLEPRLRELARLEFLDEWPDDDGTSYVFRHVLTQEAAYASLLERDRRRRHEEIGHALEELYYGRTDEVAELLALHFGHGNDSEKAVDYAIAAGEKSQRRWANNEALTYFDSALLRLDRIPGTKANQLRRIDAVLKQAELKLALGRHAEHFEALSKIEEVVETSDNPKHQVAWHYWTGFLQILTGGQASIAVGHCERAAEIAAAAGFKELDGVIASCLAQSYIIAGDLAAAIEVGNRALSIFEANKNFWWASRALWHLSSAANCQGHWNASLDYCRRALDYGIVLNDLRLRIAGLWRTACAYIQQGDTDRGLQYCDDALALSPIPFDFAAARMVRGYGLIKSGQARPGITELGDVVAWFRSSRLYHLRLLATLWLVEGHLALGDLARARVLAEEVVSFTRQSGYLHFEGVAHRLLGECLAMEAPLAAGQHIQMAVDILERVGAENDLAKAQVTYAKLHSIEGDTGTAKKLLRRAILIFEALGTLCEPDKVKRILSELSWFSTND